MLFNNSVGGGGYYDPPGAPMFAYQRQLIFDFADAGTIYDVNDYKFLHGECYDNDTTYYPTDLYGSADLPVVLHSYTGVLNLTLYEKVSFTCIAPFVFLRPEGADRYP